MMVMWILVFPATWKLGHFKTHDKLIQTNYVERYERGGRGGVVPPEIVTKYRGHSAVQFSHNLPSAFWAIAMPFQLHPGIRSKYRRVHRIVGYVTVFVSCLMMFGVFLIIKRKLTFEHSFPDLPLPNKFLIGDNKWINYDSDIGMIGISIWFLYTLFTAVQAARKGNIRKHERFMIRHVGSGIWVALQRLLLELVVSPFVPITRQQQRQVFGTAVQVAFLITVTLAEVAIMLLPEKRLSKEIKTK